MAKDVEGAKLAQNQGAIVFASPWYTPDELAETIIVNGEEYRHLNKDDYQAYTDHLIRYINFMKSNGVIYLPFRYRMNLILTLHFGIK